MTPSPNTHISDLIEWATGYKFNDDERRVTFMEVNIRREAAEYAFRKTGDKKYMCVAAKCQGLLNAMVQKAQDGQSLYLKPSELDSLLSQNA